jgi:hypothetical protein
VGGHGGGSGGGRGGRAKFVTGSVTQEDLDADLAAYRSGTSNFALTANADVCTDAEAIAAMEEGQ